MNSKKSILIVKMLFLGFAFTFFSCSDDSVDDNEIQTENTNNKLISKYFGTEAVQVMPIGNDNYLLDNSDIVLNGDQLSNDPRESLLNKPPSKDMDKLAFHLNTRKWSNNTIIYEFGNLNNALRSNFLEAINRWTTKTNIRFKERTNESDYIRVFESNDVCRNCGIASFGVQQNGFIKLGPNADTKLITHEIGHTLGFVHEHTRADRDQYVRIVDGNIKPGQESNFRKDQNAELLTGEFDIKSIMMYSPTAFSRNGQPTITLLSGSSYSGAQETISPLDIVGTNKAYPTSTNPENICDGVAEYNRSTRYYVGDRVVFQGDLYKADFTRWIFIGKCSN